MINLVIDPETALGTRVEEDSSPAEFRAIFLLGYLDSNQEQLNQNQPCCQLHHTPRGFDRSRTEGLA